jgi:hypothetical protein
MIMLFYRLLFFEDNAKIHIYYRLLLFENNI